MDNESKSHRIGVLKVLASRLELSSLRVDSFQEFQQARAANEQSDVEDVTLAGWP